MNSSSKPLVRYAVGALAALSMMLAATATMLLAWIITSHASSLIPDDSSRQGSILCQQEQDSTRCARRHSLIW